jgi:hypothetical protein
MVALTVTMRRLALDLSNRARRQWLALPAPEKVLEELKGTGGRILKTSLAHEDEARLQAALSAEDRRV